MIIVKRPEQCKLQLLITTSFRDHRIGPRILTESDPPGPVALAGIVAEQHGQEQGADVVAHRYDAGVLARDLVTLLDRGYGPVEVGVRGRVDAPDQAVQHDIRLFVCEPVTDDKHTVQLCNRSTM